MIWEIGGILTVSGILIAYLRWKSQQFERPSEIEESINRSYKDYRAFNEAGFKCTLVGVHAEKPGFPERLYKYLPYIEREGHVDVILSISAYHEDSIILPSVEEIENYELFPSHKIEIYNATWSDKPVEQANIQLRVNYFNSRYVINGISATTGSIFELMTGEVDERFHAQFKHTDLESSDITS